MKALEPNFLKQLEILQRLTTDYEIISRRKCSDRRKHSIEIEKQMLLRFYMMMKAGTHLDLREQNLK